MDDILSSTRRFFIRQKKEWGEILTNFETSNRYVISDEGGQEIWYAAERSAGLLSLLWRTFLRAMRPFTIEIFDSASRVVLSLKRPWRWYFHRLEVFQEGRLVGAVQKRFKILGRLFDIEDAAGQVVARIDGPLLHPWTFNVVRNEMEVGKIVKRWSGLLKEGFTDADTFGLEMDSPDLPIDLRKTIVGATFLVDFLHFERRN
ncbi:phospholipid scramblase-related protein [Thermodesulfobacteriota bacterium]